MIVCLGILVSPLGKVRIGGVDATPDYSYAGWFAMLFAAGMGIGLMFFGVLEPVYYFATPWGDQPLGREIGIVDGELADPATVEAARLTAMAGHDLPLGSASLGDLCHRGAFAGPVCL